MVVLPRLISALSDFGEVRDLPRVAGFGLVPNGHLEVVAEDLPKHAFQVLIRTVNAPMNRVRRDPLVDRRNLPFKIKESG